VKLRTADSRGEFGVTWFDQDTEDLIDFSFAIGSYENIALARSRGFEVEADYRVADWLGASLSYANIDARNGDGEPLIRVPRHSGNMTFALNPEGRLSGTLLLRYNGEEQDANGVVDSWTRVDLSGRYALSDAVELYARIENLLDEEYQQVIGYGTPGVSGFIGARLQF
jgi:vitamin B12 transporter